MDDNGKGSKRQRVLQVDEVLLYEGGEIAEERRREITRVRTGPQVRIIPYGAFQGCINLAEVHFDERMEIIGASAFSGCVALRQVTIPSSVTELGDRAFYYCSNLAKVQFDEGSALEIFAENVFGGCWSLRSVTLPSSVTILRSWAFYKCVNLARVQLNDGLQDIGGHAFHGCTALRNVTIPSSVTKLGDQTFCKCTNLTEVIFLGGKRLLNKGFLERGLFSGQGVLNRQTLDTMVTSNGYGRNAFRDSPLADIKISISRALSDRMILLPQKCRLSIEGRIRDLSIGRIRYLRRLELARDLTILACFPFVRSSGKFHVQDTENQTAESVHKVLRLISFHELKESSILIELAMWKSRLDEHRARADCRASIPDPAKSLIMEYCGFTDFLKPVIEGD
ncbi:hypothetical protein THAOC_36320 [Thalassiosira oceanica]|uniref:Leucine-rich repeat domain-containing protein n=1 Tax=Thalassiosira oceanica TaxID=159749 RepID=K0R8H3_THAOC|nr:hypothetical protein THAOC_36320 [Thalassiosira oceanica]|eukprot:EJK45086.1 hypothetical protein THAOC_36320 [Thalassiosira oceanica]